MRPPHGLSTDPGWRRVSSGCYVVLHCAASTAAPCPGRGSAPSLQMTMMDSSQADFFGDGQSPSTHHSPSTPEASRLKVLPRGREKLSPAQQRFNKLLARVENLGRQLQDLQQLADKLRPPHLARMAELKRKMDEARREMLVFLHQRLQRKGLTAAQQKAMREILLMQQSPSPENYPIPPYDQTRLLFEMSLFKDWFVAQYLDLSLTPEEIKVIDDCCQQIATAIAEQPTVFVHRDYHSRNLMLLANGKLGVIDFQDALMGAITYDLVSLLRDAYVEWPNQQVVAWVEEFRQLLVAQGRLTTVNQPQFLTWFDWMGAQRHLKVLGIFARLSIRDDKHGYLNDIPLVFKYLLNEIKDYPEFKQLNQLLINKILPSYLGKNPQAAAMLEKFVQ